MYLPQMMQTLPGVPSSLFLYETIAKSYLSTFNKRTPPQLSEAYVIYKQNWRCYKILFKKYTVYIEIFQVFLPKVEEDR